MAPPNNPRRIFILEDDLTYLELVIINCKKIGIEPIGARSVDEAIGLLEEMQTAQLQPVLVSAFWIDHFLPNKDGTEFVKHLRSQPAWSKIPIFLITNAVETPIINWYIHAGVQQIYPKITNLPSKIVLDIDLFLQRFSSPA